MAAGEPTIRSAVAYDGFEYLRIVQNQGTAKSIYVDADLRMIENGRPHRMYAHATETVGEGRDVIDVDGDPLNLTLLAQPFGVQLDRRTLSEIGQLQTAMPFVSMSPLTGAKLKGTLRHGIDGEIGGAKVIVLQFESTGPMRGEALPAGQNTHGEVRMRGTACYRRADGLLIKLDTLLTVNGQTGEAAPGRPVAIAYKRTIRVYGQARLIPVAYHKLRLRQTIAARYGLPALEEYL